MTRTRARYDGGFTLLEILVAVAILSVALVSVLALHARNIRLTAESQDLTIAGMLASCLASITRATPTVELGVTKGTFDDAVTYRFDLDEPCRSPDADRFSWEREVAPVGVAGSAMANLRRVRVSVGIEDERPLAEYHFLVRPGTRVSVQ